MSVTTNIRAGKMQEAPLNVVNSMEQYSKCPDQRPELQNQFQRTVKKKVKLLLFRNFIMKN